MTSSSTKNQPKAPSESIASGIRVLRQEIKGLDGLIHVLDDRFTKAVDLICALQGRVVVSGMGKSGHIARKIAATLASTGTPALFVHPGEASHGDLGMITSNDAVMLLSNSGETSELSDIIEYTRRFSIPLIGIARRKSSRLVEASDIALVLPEIEEACPVGAPTTSTIMMLALGDALAVALLEQRGFTKEDFGIFHPGGKLGKKLLKVSDLMKKDKEVPAVYSHQPMSEVLLVMTSQRLGCAAVIDKQQTLQGIITDGDLRRHMGPDLLSLTASSVMSKHPITIRPNALAAEALSIMNTHSITVLCVAIGETLEGILHIHDILRAGIG